MKTDLVSHDAVRAWRIGLCGGTRLTLRNAVFCELLGAELARQAHLQLVTGGFQFRKVSPDTPTADWSYIKGAESILEAQGPRVLESRIETMLPDERFDSAGIQRFTKGRVLRLSGRSLQARRFKLVSSVDTLLSVQGDDGTRGMIELALALDIPVLPLPFTGGACEKVWTDNKEIICSWFTIPSETATRWENLHDHWERKEPNRNELVSLASEVIGHLRRQVRPQCLVMMPVRQEYDPLYEQALKPAIMSVHLDPFRVDREHLVGNVVDAIRSAANTCVCGVAVLTGLRPNVIYEIGLMHGQNKPVVLVCGYLPHSRDIPELPYDLRVDRVIGYSETNLNQLCSELQEALAKLLGLSVTESH